MIRRLFDVLALANSLESLKRGDLVGARSKLDRVLASDLRETDFIPAYDAIVMMHEDRHIEARGRFTDCVAGLPSVKNADERYIEKFCQFWLAAYARENDIQHYRRSALDLDSRKSVRRFLKFPPEGACQVGVEGQI